MGVAQLGFVSSSLYMYVIVSQYEEGKILCLEDCLIKTGYI